MIIGKNISNEVTQFVGHMKFIGFETDLVIKQVPKANERAPGFHITDKAGYDLGVAWEEISENNNRYLSCQFDSPMFPTKIYCNLVEGRDGWQLLWNRPKPKTETKPENARFRKAA